MPNPWIEHVRRYAQAKVVTYACALSDPRVRDGYVSSKGSAPKTLTTSSGNKLSSIGKKTTIKKAKAAAGMSESALASLGAKELKTLKAADAIIGKSQTAKGEELLAKLVKRNKAVAAKKASSMLD